MSANTNIRPFYSRDDISYLFDRVREQYERKHLSWFMRRYNLVAAEGSSLAQALDIAYELPPGAFLAGGFMRSILSNTPIKDYDIFFNGEASLKLMVKRIHNAPEGSFLHGYESDISVQDLINNVNKNRKYIMFTHESKPPIQLIRTRWYDRNEEVIDKFDMTFAQFSIDSDLQISYSSQAVDDAQNKRLRLRQVIFPVSTGLRLRRFLDAGFRWYSDNYDGHQRDEYIKLGQKYLEKLKKAAQSAGEPVPENSEGFGSFEA